MSSSAQPFEITSAEGMVVATNGSATVSIYAQEGGRIFRRRAVRHVGTQGAQPVEWAVAEVDGVRCYFDGCNLVVTKQDLQP